MAWLSTHDDSNKIVDSEEVVAEQYNQGQSAAYKRTITVLKYRYVGMTEAAADSCFAALNDPPDVLASKRRENDAGAYTVDVVEVTKGAWSEV